MMNKMRAASYSSFITYHSSLQNAMLSKLYLVLGTGVLLLYVVAAWSGWELTTAPRQVLPPDVRNSPGGYRSFHFWHSGYHGGK
jgi:hypothetical protein